MNKIKEKKWELKTKRRKEKKKKTGKLKVRIEKIK